jgi:hypothetical protein
MKSGSDLGAAVARRWRDRKVIVQLVALARPPFGLPGQSAQGQQRIRLQQGRAVM